MLCSAFVRCCPPWLVFALVAALSITTSSAQCQPEWDEGPSFPDLTPGAGSSVYATTLWDPDGNGPLSRRLVIGGAFTTAGGVPANHVAIWDGTNWRSMGQGLNAAVYSLTVFNGELYAAGSFNLSGVAAVNRVARWTGVLWVPVGSGFNSVVRSVVVHNGELCAGGQFTASGATSCAHVARFNGSSWQPLGTGTNGNVYSLFSMGGRLYVGGLFSQAGSVSRANIAWWTSAAGWNSMGNGTNNFVLSMCTLGTDLIVAGSFTTVHGSGIASPAVARFVPNATSGAWASAGSLGGGRAGFNAWSVLRDGTDLYVAGSDTTNHCYKWDGAAWSAVGPAAGANKLGYTMIKFDDELVVGGTFDRISGGATLNNIARFHNAAWFPFNARIAGNIYDFAPFGSELVAAGDFYQSDPSGDGASGIIGWSPSGFRSLGLVNGFVNALYVRGNGIQLPTLIVGGVFDRADGIPVTNVAQRTNLEPATWSAMGAGFTNSNVGFNAPVFALSGFGTAGGPLGQAIPYAGGMFTHSGAVACRNVACYVSGAWQALGTGVSSTNAFEWVNCFATYITGGGNKLIVAGTFDFAGGLTANSIAAWSGSAWSVLGSPAGLRDGAAKGSVSAMVVFENTLVVGGRFTSAGGVTANNLARWNGTAWSSMSAGITNPDEQIGALAIHNGRLYAATSNTFGASGDTEGRVYRWNGASWDPVGSGYADGYINALKSYNNRLHVGGTFKTNSGIDSAYWNQINCVCPGDFDDNAQLTPSDVSAYVSAWAASISAGTLAADYDGNGQVQPADVSLFVATWFITLNAGGC